MAAFSKPSGMMGMLLTVLVVLQTVTASHSHMHMHLIHRSPEAALEVRQNSNVATKGVGDGTAYARLEIRELAKNEDQFNLYLLAMESFMSKPKNDPQSYYQVAGIHGRPFVPWNEPSMTNPGLGYCPHRNVLFGTWHRPFLALFEQALYANAQEVVESFPSDQRQKWETALQGFRMPYFDWAQEPTVSGEHIPKFIRDAQISVTKPSGQVTIRNPLASYSFGSSLPTEFGWGPQNGFPATLRNPGSGTTSNNDAVNTAFGRARTGWRQRVYALFSTKGDWGRISSSQYGLATSRQNADSYEAVHDEIHSTVGGANGHMSYLDVAAFDPIFWLHHTNIDRYLSMHQIIAPSSFVASGRMDANTAQWTQGEMKDANSPLKPFMKDTSGAWYTSSDVRETRTLGYFYKETENKDVNDVIKAINDLYGLGERGMDLESSSRSSSSSTQRPSATSASSSLAASTTARASSAPVSSAGPSSSSTPESSSGAGPSVPGSSAPAFSGPGASAPSAPPAPVTGAPGAPSAPGASAPGAGTSAPGSLIPGFSGHGFHIPGWSLPHLPISWSWGRPGSASDAFATDVSSGSDASTTKASEGDAQSTGLPGSSGNANVEKPFPGRPFKDGDYDTVLSVVGDKYALPGSCKVFCFLGNKPDRPNDNNSTSNGTLPSNSTSSSRPSPSASANLTGTDYYTLPEYVGSHTFLGASVAKTNASSPLLVEGSIPLTACLQGKIESGELKSLHPDDVEPYLEQNLHYKVIAPNGEELEPEKVPNFHAKVKSCPVTPAPEGELPTYHEYIDLPRVNIPATQPWTPPPPPAQIPSGSGSTDSPSSPVGSMPWDEPGYCVSKQTIKYVDSDGKFLYEETY